MAYKEELRMEIREIIWRWQAGNNRRHIASGTGLSRDTVSKYIAVAEQLGVSREGSAPTGDQLSRLAGIGRSGPHQAAAPNRGSTGSLGRPYLSVAHRRPVARHPYSGVAGESKLLGIVCVPAALRGSP